MQQQYYPGHLSAQGMLTPGVSEVKSMQDYKDILDEKFASPNIIVKQSQPLLSKNQFMNYLNDPTPDMPLSPRRRHMKFHNAPSVVGSSHSVTPVPIGMVGPSSNSNFLTLDKSKSYVEKFQAMQQAMTAAAPGSQLMGEHSIAGT